ncbi:unnamed protein product [Alopecurus aequalis]
MYDLEGYSLWFCEYKYQEENTVSFMTMNKVGGFLQRMDLCCKYAFGKMLEIGNEAPFNQAQGALALPWLGPRKSPTQKERVNAMIEDLEPFEGEALLDAKCFK